MEKGLPFEEVMGFMQARRVRFPITRARAVREHAVPPDALAEMERRGLVRVGKVPARHLPPPTNDARLDSFIRDLTQLGVRWPAWRHEVRGYHGGAEGTVRALQRHGLIRGPELDEGSLTPGQVGVLEWLGIDSRQAFRARMEAGDLQLRKLRNIGVQGVEKLMAWGYGDQVPEPKVTLNLRVAPETKEGLELLLLQRELGSRDEVVEKLVAEALGAAGRRRLGLK